MPLVHTNSESVVFLISTTRPDQVWIEVVFDEETQTFTISKSQEAYVEVAEL
jgi:hypothetical protein